MSDLQRNSDAYKRFLDLLSQHDSMHERLDYKNIQVVPVLLSTSLANTSCRGSASIAPASLGMTRDGGERMSAKMVDLAIFLKFHGDLERSFRKILKLMPSDAKPLNQTMYPSFRNQPVAVSVRTKQPDARGAIADVQLGT